MKKLLLSLIILFMVGVSCEGGTYVPREAGSYTTGSYTPRSINHFETVDELKEWIERIDTVYNSDRDRAFGLQKKAAEDGYLLSAWVSPPMFTLYGLVVTNTALIGDAIYTIRGDEVELWFIFTSYP